MISVSGPETIEDLHVTVFQPHIHPVIHVKLLIDRICEVVRFNVFFTRMPTCFQPQSRIPYIGLCSSELEGVRAAS